MTVAEKYVLLAFRMEGISRLGEHLLKNLNQISKVCLPLSHAQIKSFTGCSVVIKVSLITQQRKICEISVSYDSR